MSVPISPGVPALPSGVGTPAPNTPVLTSDGPGVSSQGEDVVWGIFDSNNNPVITGDSVKVFEYRNTYEISDYPIEQGGFKSYNKVATPYDIRLTFVQGGNIDARASFLNSLRSTLADLNLYRVITKEVAFDSANIVNISYRRTSREGVTLLTVEVWVREVRVTGVAEFENTATPDGADQQDDGQIPPRKPTQQTNTPAAAATATTPATPGTISGTLPDITVPLAPSSPAAQIQFNNNPSFITIGPGASTPVNLVGPQPTTTTTGSEFPTTGFTPIM